MNKEFVIDVVKNRLIALGVAKSEEIIGCSSEQIKALEEHFSVKLPKLYREFLSIMGIRAGSFYVGTQIFYDSLFVLKEAAQSLLKFNKVPFVLPKDAFVFLSHQGYQFMYFCTDTNEDDPAVYYYLEGEHNVVKYDDSFSDFLIKSVEDYEKIYHMNN